MELSYSERLDSRDRKRIIIIYGNDFFIYNVLCWAEYL